MGSGKNSWCRKRVVRWRHQHSHLAETTHEVSVTAAVALTRANLLLASTDESSAPLDNAVRRYFANLACRRALSWQPKEVST